MSLGTFGPVTATWSSFEQILVSWNFTPAAGTTVTGFKIFSYDADGNPGPSTPTTGVISANATSYIIDVSNLSVWPPSDYTFAVQARTSRGNLTSSSTEPALTTCFHEDTKILTINGYIPIKNLHKGDLIQTYKHGFLPIHLLGCSYVNNLKTKERTTNGLYKYSQNKFSELFEDLILTGWHSILVDDFVNQEQMEKNKNVFGGVNYMIDDKYRLLSCVDDNAILYEKEGVVKVYHLAFENSDELANYGIYANGLLVESCTIKHIKENMNLVE